jgi:hypothetical protein
MKTPLLLLLALFTLTALRAEDARETALRAADDARIAAMKAPEREKLATIFSDELHYAHSSGAVDTKASFIDALVSERSKYVRYEPLERKFTFPAPGVALMTGRAQLEVANATGGMKATLSYLAVWRQEQGQWRFLAWQSCRLP